MNEFPWTALVTLLAFVVYLAMIIGVGSARGRAKIAAPAMIGDPNFERMVRVQMNTLESFPVYLGSLWLFASHWGDQWAAGIGAFWIVGRFIYWRGYLSDPKARSPGFMVQSVSMLILLIGALAGVAQILVATFAH